MEYQIIANLLDNEINQPSKFRTKYGVEINDESRGIYTGNDIRFKSTLLRCIHTCKLKNNIYWSWR